MTRSTRRQFLASTALAACAVSSVGRRALFAADDSLARPNILLLVADDQRADSLSCAGNPVLKTPNIDALAAGGVRFTNSFATTAICMSSRASILTGLYSRVHGVDDFVKPLAGDLFKQSYPTLLHAAGYRTGFVGKWGIDAGEMPVADFDFFKGYQGQGNYFPPGAAKHLTAIQTDQALEFLRGCSHKQPFCLAVSFKAPHVQDEGRYQPGIYAKYPYDHAFDHAFESDRVPPIRTRDKTKIPDFLVHSMNCTRESSDFIDANFQESMKDIYRLIAGVDQAVGQLAAELKTLGFDQNTVIIYTSDHGSFYGEHGFGGKWLMHEESIRTPMIIRDPRLPAARKGTVCDQMVLNLDLPSTLLDMANVAIPPGMQGRSLMPLVQGESVGWRDEWFYENHFRNVPVSPIIASEGIRTRHWKYIRYIDQEPACEQLFHLASDPREEINLALNPDHETILKYFQIRWRCWQMHLDHREPGGKWTDPLV